MRSGPGSARTILLFHIISARSSKQPLRVRTFLKVYMDLGSYFLFLQEQTKDIIIIITPDESKGSLCPLSVSGSRTILLASLGRLTTLLPRFDPR